MFYLMNGKSWQHERSESRRIMYVIFLVFLFKIPPPPECWAATTFFGKTSTPFFFILFIPSYTICNKQYTICNSRAYFPLPRLVFDGWRLLSEALFCNRTTCPLVTRLRLSQLFCPLLNNWYTFQIDDQNKDKNRQLTNIGYSWTLPWLKNCSVA